MGDSGCHNWNEISDIKKSVNDLAFVLRAVGKQQRDCYDVGCAEQRVGKYGWHDIPCSVLNVGN